VEEARRRRGRTTKTLIDCFIRRDVDRFAALPDGVRHPEGITAILPTAISTSARLMSRLRQTQSKKQAAALRPPRRDVASLDFGNTPLLGLGSIRQQALYILNVGNFAGVASKIQRVAADSPADGRRHHPGIGAPDRRTVGNRTAAPTRSLRFRRPCAQCDGLRQQRDLYVSDSFQGAIFKITKPGGLRAKLRCRNVSHDPLLATPVSAFAANGLAFNPDESALSSPIRATTACQARHGLGTKKVTIFAESINGADGLAFDQRAACGWRPTKPMKYWP